MAIRRVRGAGAVALCLPGISVRTWAAVIVLVAILVVLLAGGGSESGPFLKAAVALAAAAEVASRALAGETRGRWGWSVRRGRPGRDRPVGM